jgi:hypothetical protein
MARPENKQQTQTLSITVPQATYGYLSYLAVNSTLGANENDVAVRLLTDRINELLLAKFHEATIPKA